MAGKYTATITGQAEVFATLDAMAPEPRGRVVNGALIEIGTNLQRTIQTKFLEGPAPRKLERRTGKTIRSIVLDRSGLSRGYVDIGSLAELWWLENYEFGRGARGRRPFLRPAFKLVEPTIEGVFARHWAREIDHA